MKAAYWFVLSTVLVLSGCGDLMFGAAEEYALGNSSCRTIEDSCGPLADEDCCAAPLVPEKSADETDATWTSTTVRDFRLDRFEVTVGRFREFVKKYPGDKPAEGYGAHPRIPKSGWNPAWDSMLPANQEALKTSLQCNSPFQTWTDAADEFESLPINCVDWYLAFAFCAWDGGRLPTDAEWNHAARGGVQNRLLPWSDPPNALTIASNYASYDCLADGSDRWECAFVDILAVGSNSPNGDGLFGQTDLAGNMREWVLDAYRDSTTDTCDDCDDLPAESSPRVLRGGAWDLGAGALMNSSRHQASPAFRFYDIGFRCARDL